jgi:D-alanyl-D-alanine carboxypeptidase/D-alanyl-D-alanine-endopeptidase (penicillin-binding protein 4)
VVAVLTGAAAAQPAPLAAAAEALVSDPHLAGARIGVHVRDLATGAILVRLGDDRGCLPASNMKLLSAAVALLTLGPDFTFVTRLEARGDVVAGSLRGDLVLVGGGDPTLGGRQERDQPRVPLARFAHLLRSEHGIERIEGAVLGDDDCQPDEVMGEGWAWGYEASDYAAQVSGLCFAENVVRLEWSATAAAARPVLRLCPPTSYLAIDDTVTAGGTVTAIAVARERGSNRVSLSGRLGRGRTHADAVTVENPTAFAAHELRECLLEAGVAVCGPAADADVRPPRPAAGRVLAEHRSPPLRELLPVLNKASQNLYAEQLVRAAARAAAGRSHMRDAAAHAAQVLGGLGVDVRGLVMADGSGLSRLNLVQPRQLGDLLAALWRSEHRDLFLASLPVAGVDGTLAERLRDGPARGHVRAKTGFISRVVALSGYVPRPDPAAPPLVFSVLLNDFTCDTSLAKAAADAFAQALARAAGW